MKKMFMAVIALMMTISASAQFYIYYSDGTVAKVDSISMVAPDEPEKPDPSAGIGAFSVSADKQVTFSKGNLQYTQSTDTWSFASTQYEIIGIDNLIGDSVSFTDYGDRKDAGTALADKIDLFGLSTNANYFGASISNDRANYSGSFVDWGSNTIGHDTPNTWRTLTLDEWFYLFYDRTNARDLFGIAQVNGINGLILLPDNWVCPEDVTFKSGIIAYRDCEGVDCYATYQTFTIEQWAKLETTGAVFLPAAGWRWGSRVTGVNYQGDYWPAIEEPSDSAVGLEFDTAGPYRGGTPNYVGRSVRLVKDL